MKTFREIAEMHYASEPNNEFDKQYRENRINALEKLLTEQLRIHYVSGRSEQCNHIFERVEKGGECQGYQCDCGEWEDLT